MRLLSSVVVASIDETFYFHALEYIHVPTLIPLLNPVLREHNAINEFFGCRHGAGPGETKFCSKISPVGETFAAFCPIYVAWKVEHLSRGHMKTSPSRDSIYAATLVEKA